MQKQIINIWKIIIKLNWINNQPDIDKILLYAKNPYEAKYQYLSNKREEVASKHYDDLKAFVEYSNDMPDVHKNIKEYNLRKKHEVLIIFNDMIADMINNKKLNLIVTELFIGGRKLNISIVFIIQWYFKVPKEARLNITHFYILRTSTNCIKWLIRHWLALTYRRFHEDL